MWIRNPGLLFENAVMIFKLLFTEGRMCGRKGCGGGEVPDPDSLHCDYSDPDLVFEDCQIGFLLQYLVY
jgi:hypothetical protein